MNPKLPFDGHIYILTVGSVLTTNVSQSNLCQLLFRATLKVRLDSCLSLLLEWTAPKKECAFQKIHSLSTGGDHSRVEASITNPTSFTYAAKQLTALFHTQPLFSSFGYQPRAHRSVTLKLDPRTILYPRNGICL